MKLVRYQGENEKEAMLKVKEELGKDALIVNIKTIKPKGFYKLFRKTSIEVTAAVDENISNSNEKKANKEFITNEKSGIIEQKTQNENLDIKGLEKKIEDIQSLFLNQEHVKGEPKSDNEVTSNKVNQIIKSIYNQLLDNEVDEAVANEIIQELHLKKTEDLDNALMVAYNKIIEILEKPEILDEIEKGSSKKVFFIGPTGVGKTTTIAKIASHYVLNQKKNVALITADTYRIAAVEQLRTYANILCIPLKVIYSVEEMEEAINEFQDKDLILIDTAGRSHKNEIQIQELGHLIGSVEDKETYLVLSATTKYKDLINITKRYNHISNYKLIFTKFDETSCYGNILNIKKKTNAKLSYSTFGQNVPDDIKEIDVQEIAKHLLGGNE
ncbi:flagellar biosynthesis protein FlhF [Natranaerovirga hydrolytica]|uniref:Flagellar biosynthesis protein FlhF n=1 Tax=Natranaerovirga hydrolytica TaxID=680378 RepID=A0A4R1MZ76_9FIRM|nr:flagellar biosynthesis protein FlhF [Natranaerovirga hydrolytica]TCK97910.1 flagellar biosynthesis protein FlhF [Natranaerovirga hydrolytica]